MLNHGSSFFLFEFDLIYVFGRYAQAMIINHY